MKYIICIFVFILSLSALATPTCSQKGTIVYYTNGVTTPKMEADIARRKIRDLGLSNQIDLKSEKVQYILAYNYQESPAKDFLEAAVQRFPQSFLKSKGVSNGYAAFIGFLNGGLSEAIYSIQLNSIINKYLEIQSNWIINHFNQELYLKTVDEIKSHYERSLNRGERVFAISHSQGGLFMEDALNKTAFVDKYKYFSGFQIASPLENEMVGNFGYATHDKDRLVNFIRSTIGALPAYVVAPAYLDNSYTGTYKDNFIEFFINHGISTTYLYDQSIKSQVKKELIKTAQLLESNCFKAVINYTKQDQVVNFDSSDPENPNASGLTYEWNFGDGITLTTTQPRFSHTYENKGTYQVTLTVTDKYGSKEVKSIEIEIEKNPIGDMKFCAVGPYNVTFDFAINNPTNDIFSLSYSSGKCECKSIQTTGEITDYTLRLNYQGESRLFENMASINGTDVLYLIGIGIEDYFPFKGLDRFILTVTSDLEAACTEVIDK